MVLMVFLVIARNYTSTGDFLCCHEVSEVIVPGVGPELLFPSRYFVDCWFHGAFNWTNVGRLDRPESPARVQHEPS